MTLSQATGTLRANFHQAIRLWRLFKVMKNNGFKNYKEMESSSVVQTCPACPHPDINLDENWKERPNGYDKNNKTTAFALTSNNRKLLHSLCISGNGNFHMQSRLTVKDLVQDPSFFGDSGFFVPYETYQKYTEASQALKGRQKVCSIVPTRSSLIYFQGQMCRQGRQSIS